MRNMALRDRDQSSSNRLNQLTLLRFKQFNHASKVTVDVQHV